MKKERMIVLFKNKSAIYLILLGIGFGLSATMTLNILYLINAHILTAYAENISRLTEPGSFLGRAVFICLAGPVIEELIYRGVLFGVLKRFLPYIWACLLQAVIFGISHYNPVQAVYTFILGLILGYVYHKYQSILAPIFVHIGYNISGFLIPKFLTIYVFSGIKNTVILFLIIISVLMIGIFLFRRYFLKVKNFSDPLETT